MAQKTKPNTPTDQHKRFLETAHALECDEDEAKFEKKLAKIAVQQTIRGKATAPKARRKP